MTLSDTRRAQLTATRKRLNDQGDRSYYAAGFAWDCKRIRVRNKINARLARA